MDKKTKNLALDEDLVFPLPFFFLLFTFFRLLVVLPYLWITSVGKSPTRKIPSSPDKPEAHPPTAPTLLIGHRGARTDTILENSRQAFLHAELSGVDGIELDTFSTKDGEMVVFHDSTLDRTAQGSGKVSDLTRGELEKIPLKNGEKIPFLEEILREWGGKFLINIEIKKEMDVASTKKSCELVAQIWKDSGIPSRSFVISSFSPLALYYIRKFAPSLPRAQLIADPKTSRIPGWKGKVLGSWAFALAWSDYGMVWEKSIFFRKKELIQLAHRWGKKVWIYTSNDPKEWEMGVAEGLDGIITDTPADYRKKFPSSSL